MNLPARIAISVALLAPCFWQSRVEAGDLASHTYNAWLALLVRRGQAPGLWIGRLNTNLLFEVLLERLGGRFGMPAAERVTVSACVLIFFWGAFSLVCSANHRKCWSLLPLLAVLTYGHVFHVGFFNYYLSLGLSFFAVAIAWQGPSATLILLLPLLALAWLAHPLPVLWAIATCAYVWIARKLAAEFRLALFLLSLLALAGLRHYLMTHLGGQWSFWQSHFLTGADQVWVFGRRYLLLGAATLMLCAGCLAVELWRLQRLRAWFFQSDVTFQLYALSAAAVALLPNGLVIPGVKPPLTAISARLSLITAVLGCALLGTLPVRRWRAIAFTLVAVVYFSFLYADVGTVNQAEQRVEALVKTLPPRHRVVASISFPASRLDDLSHILDRACIDRCFSYGNYEPSASVFRVRAATGNGIVMSDYSDVLALQWGTYTVKREDVPLYQVYRCGTRITELCLRTLEIGESTALPTAPIP